MRKRGERVDAIIVFKSMFEVRGRRQLTVGRFEIRGERTDLVPSVTTYIEKGDSEISPHKAQQ